MLKKITAAVIGLTATGFTIAGTMGPICAPGQVTVPCEAKHWSLGIDALYLNMFEGGARSYRYNGPDALTRANNNWGWGFRAEGAYQFNLGQDITINWSHLDSRFDQSFPNGGVLTPFGFNEPAYNLVKQEIFDQVNLIAGQKIDFSATNKVRLYGGLQYAAVQAIANNWYPAFVIPTVSTSASNYDNSNYKGVGPTLGVDYSYYVTPEISLIAGGSTSLLYGTSRLSTGLVVYPNNVTISSSSRYGSKKVIVNGFEGKLGVNYAYNMAQGLVNLEAGYQVIDYFNILQGYPLQNYVTGSVSFVDFGLYGPYFGIKYVGNA